MNIPVHLIFEVLSAGKFYLVIILTYQSSYNTVASYFFAITENPNAKR